MGTKNGNENMVISAQNIMWTIPIGKKITTTHLFTKIASWLNLISNTARQFEWNEFWFRWVITKLSW